MKTYRGNLYMSYVTLDNFTPLVLDITGYKPSSDWSRTGWYTSD